MFVRLSGNYTTLEMTLTNDNVLYLELANTICSTDIKLKLNIFLLNEFKNLFISHSYGFRTTPYNYEYTIRLEGNHLTVNSQVFFLDESQLTLLNNFFNSVRL